MLLICGAAKRAMKWVLDEYASMTDRFALICMAFIYPERMFLSFSVSFGLGFLDTLLFMI